MTVTRLTSTNADYRIYSSIVAAMLMFDDERFRFWKGHLRLERAGVKYVLTAGCMISHAVPTLWQEQFKD